MTRSAIQHTIRTDTEISARQRIVATARRQFFTSGFRGITMDDLARELGMSKKTLYSCFHSKIALLRAVMLAKVEEIEASFKSIEDADSNDFLAEFRTVLAIAQHNLQEIQPPFIRDLQRDAPELFSLIEERRRAMIHRHFKGLLERGRKAGTVRRDVPIDLIIEILLGTIQAIVNPSKMIELGLTPQTGLSAILRIMLEGVIVRAGRTST
jgi:AcrR family transcriptional regulator